MKDFRYGKLRRLRAMVLMPQSGLLAFLVIVSGCGSPSTAAGPPSMPVKMMIISMFALEAQPWITNLNLTQEIPVRGLSDQYPAVHCNSDAVCDVTIGAGHANAAASTMALLLNGKFDLTRTYFLIAGIAGIDPRQGTIGSAAWALQVIDFGLEYELDAREMPAGWESGYFAIGSLGPGQLPPTWYGTEHYELNPVLLNKIIALTGPVKLADSAIAQAYRANYPYAPANQPPKIIQCDTASGDTYWNGRVLGVHAEQWVALLTGGKGAYCTTEQEDNATMAALTRGARAGLIDISRVALLRTGSDFDRPFPGQSAYTSLIKGGVAFPVAAANLYNAAVPWVNDVISNWSQWQAGVPE